MEQDKMYKVLENNLAITILDNGYQLIVMERGGWIADNIIVSTPECACKVKERFIELYNITNIVVRMGA